MNQQKIMSDLMEILHKTGELKGKLERAEDENKWLRSQLAKPDSGGFFTPHTSEIHTLDFYEEALRYKDWLKRLAKYTVHFDNCKSFKRDPTFTFYPCTCGLSTLLEGISKL